MAMPQGIAIGSLSESLQNDTACQLFLMPLNYYSHS
jgi:hypothetical protein